MAEMRELQGQKRGRRLLHRRTESESKQIGGTARSKPGNGQSGEAVRAEREERL